MVSGHFCLDYKITHKCRKKPSKLKEKLNNLRGKLKCDKIISNENISALKIVIF